MNRTIAILALALAVTGAASAADTSAQAAERQRHKEALMQIRKIEIDDRNEYRNAVIACRRDLDCKNDAKIIFSDANARTRMLRNDEDALFKKNMLEIKVSGSAPANTPVPQLTLPPDPGGVLRGGGPVLGGISVSDLFGIRK